MPGGALFTLEIQSLGLPRFKGGKASGDVRDN